MYINVVIFIWFGFHLNPPPPPAPKASPGRGPVGTDHQAA